MSWPRDLNAGVNPVTATAEARSPCSQNPIHLIYSVRDTNIGILETVSLLL